MEFPFVSQYLGNGDRRMGWHVKPEQFHAAVAKCEAAHQHGTIANQEFQQAKETLNRMLYDAWQYAINARYTYEGRWKNLPCEVYEFEAKLDYPQLHTAKGKLAKVSKTKLRHPMIDDMRAFLADIAPLADLVADLKGMVVKRQPKPVEEKKEGYQPPKVSTEAEKQVVAILEAVTEASYQELVDHIFSIHRLNTDRFLAMQTLSNEYGYSLAPKEYFGPMEAMAVQEALEPTGEQLPYSVFRSAYQANIWKQRKDWKGRLMAVARKEADEIRSFFVNKNFAKIASVVEAKGNFLDGKQIGYRVQFAGLTGTMKFRFGDGSSFVVDNAVVWSRSARGTVFRRFPLTFHNVILSDGSKMSRPSEQRMNEVFTKAAR